MTSNKEMLNSIHNFKRSVSDDEALDLLDQWFNADPFSRTRITGDLCIPDDNDLFNSIYEENGRLFKECNIIGTPTFFINGYLLPIQYDLDDIKSFLAVFKGEKEVLK